MDSLLIEPCLFRAFTLNWQNDLAPFISERYKRPTSTLDQRNKRKEMDPKLLTDHEIWTPFIIEPRGKQNRTEEICAFNLAMCMPFMDACLRTASFFIASVQAVNGFLSH